MPFYFVGHRGAGTLVPENTLASFTEAVRLGVNQIELDLRLSADGQIVVIHDATVDRTTTGSGPVADMTLDQLQRLDAGQGHRIPTFAEVLDHTEVSLQVEIKDPAVLEPLRDLLAARPDRDVQRLEFTSFDPVVVGRTATLWPQVVSGLIGKVASPALIDQAVRIGARRVLVHRDHITPEFVHLARAEDLRVDLWPVEDADHLQIVCDLGLDGFTTDDPLLVQREGYTWQDGRLVRT